MTIRSNAIYHARAAFSHLQRCGDAIALTEFETPDGPRWRYVDAETGYPVIMRHAAGGGLGGCVDEVRTREAVDAAKTFCIVSRENRALIREHAIAAAKRQGAVLGAIDIGERCHTGDGDFPDSFNCMLVGDAGTAAASDLADKRAWSTVAAQGVKLDAFGRAKFDLYLYDMGRDLVTNMQVYMMRGIVVAICDGFEILYQIGGHMFAANFPLNAPASALHALTKYEEENGDMSEFSTLAEIAEHDNISAVANDPARDDEKPDSMACAASTGETVSEALPDACPTCGIFDAIDGEPCDVCEPRTDLFDVRGVRTIDIRENDVPSVGDAALRVFGAGVAILTPAAVEWMDSDAADFALYGAATGGLI